jgi:hypothetical protein
MPERSTIPSRSWPILFVEAVLIVLSILIAFLIEAWWNDRQEQEALYRSLSALHSDFVENLSIMGKADEAHRRIKSASEHVMSLTGPSPPAEIEEERLADAILTLTFRPVLRPLRGSLDSLLNSGQWDLIENTALRTELAEWPTLVSRVNGRELQGQRTVLNNLVPLIWKQAPIRTIDATDPDFKHIGPSRFPFSYQTLLQDQVFEGVVDERWWDSHECINSLDRLADSTQSIISLLEAEISP